MAEKNEDPQSETRTPYEVDSKESLISNKGDEVILNVSDLERKPLCRICYSGSSKEKLIRPCKCKEMEYFRCHLCRNGTIEHVHRHCLERWLEAKNVDVCELCQHEFHTRRSRRSCWEMLRAPEMQSERRNFIGDCTCFAFLTPLAVATLWLCVQGAIYYQEIKGSPLETAALSFLAVFLLVAYFTWVILCTKYHRTMLAQWQDRSWNIRIVDRPPSDEVTLTIPRDLAQDSTDVTDQSPIRYAKGADYVTMLSVEPPENDTTRQQLNERPEPNGWI